MTSSPKRPWFRFHLLTAVLMMVAAGGLLSVALAPPSPDRAAFETEPPVYYGFPISAVRWESFVYEPSDDGSKLYGLGANAYRLDCIGFTIELLTLLALLSAIALASESLIRRRDGRER